jgi:hypothetical protein
MARMDKVCGNNTAVFTDETGGLCIVLHRTRVVYILADRSAVMLKSGGHKTTTTKARMNQAAAEYNLPYHVFSKDGEWRVYSKLTNDSVPFFDGMTVATRITQEA